MDSRVKTAIACVVLVCVAIFLWTRSHAPETRPQTRITFSHFIADVKAGRVKSVTINGSEVQGTYAGSEGALRTYIPTNYPQLYDLLEEKGVDIDIAEQSSGNLLNMLINAIPFILLLAFWLFMMRQMQSGSKKAGGGSGKTAT